MSEISLYLLQIKIQYPLEQQQQKTQANNKTQANKQQKLVWKESK